MITFLSSWVKNLALALILVSILEMIIPNNKTKKYVKMIMGLYILFSIVSPFIENSDKFNFNNLNLDSVLQDTKQTSSLGEEIDQTSMDNRLNDIYKEQLEKDIIQKIKVEGYEVESCKVSAHISDSDSGIESINVKIKSKINFHDEIGNEKENTNSIENVIVKEIQKIQNVDIKISENSQDEEREFIQEESNITKTDIKIIKKFLVKEYGVNEKCLKIS